MSSLRPKLAVLAAGSLLLVLAAAPAQAAPAQASKAYKPYGGGYYVGKTAAGGEVTLDVQPNGKRVAAVQFGFDCAGQQDTKMSAQSLKIKKKNGKYRFSGTQTGALLFPSFLSEEAQITVSGRWTSRKKAVGTFRVVSPTCGDTGKISYSVKVL